MGIAVQYAGDGITGLSRPGRCFHSRADNELSTRRESGRITDVVEVVVGPDYGFNVAAPDTQAAGI